MTRDDDIATLALADLELAAEALVTLRQTNPRAPRLLAYFYTRSVLRTLQTEAKTLEERRAARRRPQGANR